MSKKNCRCGIYCITTPAGNEYVGSSRQIENRWSQHRSLLRMGKHHSDRLQAAWDKHGDRLVFSVILECPAAELNEREQEAIDARGATLNTSMFVANVWLNEGVRAKMKVIHTSAAWRAKRAKIAADSSTRWVAVDCSDGASYKNMADAARAFGVRVSQIAALMKSQRAGRLGVRFKRSEDQWRDVLPARAQAFATMVARGKHKRSDEARAKMSVAKKGRPVSQQCLDAARAANMGNKHAARKAA